MDFLVILSISTVNEVYWNVATFKSAMSSICGEENQCSRICEVEQSHICKSSDLGG